MAMSPEHVTALIDLHRKIATLEAELSHAQTNNRQLELTIQRLLQPLPALSPEGRLHLTNYPSQQQPEATSQDFQNCVAREVESGPVTPSPPHQPNVSTVQINRSRVEQTRARANSLESSDSDERLQPGDNRKLNSIAENPHAPRFIPFGQSQGYWRTAIIQGVSEAATLKELARNVCGGLVVSMKLLETTKCLDSNSNTALVEFFETNSALNFIEHCNRAPLVFGDKQAEVKLINSPTTPVSPATYHNIVDYGATRCVVIEMCPSHLSMHDISTKLSPPEHYGLNGILDMFEDESGFVHIVFDSVDAASSARARINTYSTFKPARAEFKADPCAIPCSSLSEREAKPTMFINYERPRLRFGPPRGPRAMRGRPPPVGPPPFRSFRGYKDMDAPRPFAPPPRSLDYELETARGPPPTPIMSRAQPLDYGDFPTTPKPKDDSPLPSQPATTAPAIDGTRPKSPDTGSESSLESGEIIETTKQSSSADLEHLSMEASQHAPNPVQVQQASDPFAALVNRHLGPPAQIASGASGFTPQDTAPQENMPRDNTPQDTTPQDTTPQDTTPQNTTPQDTTPQDTTPQDTTPQDTTTQDTTPQDNTPRDATPQNTTPHDFAPRRLVKYGSDGSDSDTDSVESARAKRRRHVDAMWAAMHAGENKNGLDY